ncbi:MAG: hypothetical protein LC739_02320 [Actinobacteria bacterium]|nr:hypothetical protein [Actinomycetota bacterium]
MRRGVFLFAVALVLLAALPARADDLGAAINAVRSTSLQLNGAVDAFAQAASDRIAVGQVLVHSNLASVLGTCSAAGEVMAYGPNVGAIMQGWAGSPGHWSVITQGSWNAMGTGVSVDATGQLWVAVVFCTLPSAPAAPPTTVPPTTAPPTTAPPTTVPRPVVIPTTAAPVATTSAPVATTTTLLSVTAALPLAPDPVIIRLGPGLNRTP